MTYIFYRESKVAENFVKHEYLRFTAVLKIFYPNQQGAVPDMSWKSLHVWAKETDDNSPTTPVFGPHFSITERLSTLAIAYLENSGLT